MNHWSCQLWYTVQNCGLWLSHKRKSWMPHTTSFNDDSWVLHGKTKCTMKFEDIRNQTKLQRRDLIIKERRLGWLGHVLRIEDDMMPKQATRWQMDSCTRRAGRPSSNWIDTVTRDLKSTGMAWEDAEQAAVDREDWSGRVDQCVFDTGWTKV